MSAGGEHEREAKQDENTENIAPIIRMNSTGYMKGGGGGSVQIQRLAHQPWATLFANQTGNSQNTRLKINPIRGQTDRVISQSHQDAHTVHTHVSRLTSAKPDNPGRTYHQAANMVRTYVSRLTSAWPVRSGAGHNNTHQVTQSKHTPQN